MNDAKNDMSAVEKLAMDAASTALESQPCAACHYSVPTASSMGKTPMLECREGPPSLFLVPMHGNVIGGSPKILKQSGFPNCMDICGKFKKRIPGYDVGGQKIE